jgi:hypothetical protein
MVEVDEWVHHCVDSKIVLGYQLGLKVRSILVQSGSQQR